MRKIYGNKKPARRRVWVGHGQASAQRPGRPLDHSGSQSSARTSAIAHGQSSGKVLISNPLSFSASALASTQISSIHSGSISIGPRLGVLAIRRAKRRRCSLMVSVQLTERFCGWNCHLRIWASSTAMRLASSRCSLLPTSSISSAMCARSSSSKRPARMSDACSLAQATTSFS